MCSYLDEFNLWKQGAEAKLYSGEFLGKTAVAKERFPKKYRHPAIDERITKKRVSQEVKALQRCRKNGIHTPHVYFVDVLKNVIILEKVDGTLLKDLINTHISKQSFNDDSKVSESLERLLGLFGKCLAVMHNANIIHGDLTTSNIIITKSSNGDYDDHSVCLIDFGLSSVSSLAEDKGVDIYVLERAFLSSHPNTEKLFQHVLTSYRQSSSDSKAVLKKLEDVKLRGRKRSMIG